MASQVVAIATERICTYPFENRPARIAANVILDTRQRLWQQRERLGVELRDDLALVPPVAEPTPSEEVLTLVSSAVRRGAITRKAGRIIV